MSLILTTETNPGQAQWLPPSASGIFSIGGLSVSTTVNAYTTANLGTVSVDGALVGAPVVIGIPSSVNMNMIYQARVESPGVVTIYATNLWDANYPTTGFFWVAVLPPPVA